MENDTRFDWLTHLYLYGNVTLTFGKPISAFQETDKE